MHTGVEAKASILLTKRHGITFCSALAQLKHLIKVLVTNALYQP